MVQTYIVEHCFTSNSTYKIRLAVARKASAVEVVAEPLLKAGGEVRVRIGEASRLPYANFEMANQNGMFGDEAAAGH